MHASKWTLRLALATWILTLSWIAVFAVFWRLSYLTPHGVWAAASVLSIAGATTTLIALCLWQLIYGPKRLLTVAVGILGLTPIVWLAIFFADLKYNYVHHRVKVSPPVRIAAFWMSSALDLEARWLYPRRTTGRYLELIDDGSSPNAEQLVAKMDRHIDEMVPLLGHPVPPASLPWCAACYPVWGT